MTNMQMPQEVYAKKEAVILFNQLAVKVEMDSVSNEDYFGWLDRMSERIGGLVPGARIAEKENARQSPPLNIAVYYDTIDYRVLPTGALLRTSCNRITHAFCAFKMTQDEHSVRGDYRYVFEGEEKLAIQTAPTSNEAIAIVKRLLSRNDIEHPGKLLEKHFGIRGTELEPALSLHDLRYTFFVWLDNRDALRCSIDRATVADLRIPEPLREWKPVSEVEIAIYPHIDPQVARDPRVVELINVLSSSLCAEFKTRITREIKYQRSARVLGIHSAAAAN